jgi:hypothetical protein
MRTTRPALGNKRFALATIALLSVSLAFAQTARDAEGEVEEAEYLGKVAISRIKISIDDYLYIWERDSKGPQASPDNPPDSKAPKTRPETVMGLIGIKPGDVFDQKALDDLVETRQRQLSETNVFFSNRITILPVRSDPELRSLRVDVRVGFPWRPFGGAAFAALGNENADGNLLTWGAALGYNYDAFSLGWGNRKAGPFWWSAGLSYSNNLLSGQSPTHTLGANAALGSAWLPFSPCLGAEAWATYSAQAGAVSQTGIKFTPSVSWSKTIGKGDFALALGAYALCSVPMESPAFLPIWQPEARVQIRPVLGPVTLAFQLGAGMTSARSEDFPMVPFVRGGFADAESLRMDRYAQFNAELRLNQGTISFPFFITTMDLMPYGYFDFATGSDLGDGGAPAASVFAGGFGLRLLLGIPVMVGFDFAYGWSDEGLGIFSFAIGTGY